MVIDTSALIAILLDELERRHFNELIESDPVRLISVASFVEATMVMRSKKGAGGVVELERLIREAGVSIQPVDLAQGKLAQYAFARYGKGLHRARLNFGDCFAYALAMHLDEPLLFKGNDFNQTDVNKVI